MLGAEARLTTWKGRSWRDVHEIGSVLGMRLLAGLCRLLGRRVVGLLLHPIVLYYLLAKPLPRRASRAYLLRSAGATRVSWIRVYRHLLCFAECTLDRYLFVAGRTRGLEVSVHGHHYLERAAVAGRGALLLGAHLGSFEAMRAASARSNLRLSIVADFRWSRRLSGMLERLNPGLSAQVIPVGDGLETVFRIKDRIAAGELVALLADRVSPQDRAVSTTFLGEMAAFPAGPYLLAATLACPVLLAFGIHKTRNRYEVHCEPFANRIVLPQRHRDPALSGLVQRYAARLEHYCRLAPDNWFNFFDTWGTLVD
jgi:predicted LPLAT superfamily acyltransferase